MHNSNRQISRKDIISRKEFISNCIRRSKYIACTIRVKFALKLQKYLYLWKRTFHERHIPLTFFASYLKGKVAREGGTGGGHWNLISLTRNEFFLRGSERRDACPLLLLRFACQHRSRACVRVKRFSAKIKSKEDTVSRHDTRPLGE